jgi:hypothetical protein
LLLSSIILLAAASILVKVAGARADFPTFADRTTRPAEPLYYDINGTSTETIVSWPGVRGVGNLGIGSGDPLLVEPEFINNAMKSFAENMTKNATAPGNATGEAIVAPQNNLTGNRTMISGNVTPGNNVSQPVHDHVANGLPEPEEERLEEKKPEEPEPLTESLLPEHVLAAGVITRTEPYSITYGQPFPHILNEDPVEPGVIYGKMFGLPLPGGRVIDIGIKSLGSEF